ncbi:DUF72 domain-containing protein [Candidatus Bathyarchaeota archaeon]|nr:MAG: DUF72 domain-containing protein [Candidatus Bathyarchaeota archaeon]
MKTKAMVGVSGFSYAGWKGNFYPENLKSEEFLSYYAQRLNSVEINSSFYSPPSISMVKSWAGRTGDNFRFSFKAPRQITHILKLGKGSVEATERLGVTLRSLGEKNGPILFQLPPYSRQDLKLLEDFLTNTSKMGERVFEFRHESWLNDLTYSTLEKHDADFCIADTEDMKPVFKVTGKVPYFRLRRESYDEKMIVDWTEKIREASRGSESLYVYLRHDETGDNAARALKILESLA